MSLSFDDGMLIAFDLSYPGSDVFEGAEDRAVNRMGLTRRPRGLCVHHDWDPHRRCGAGALHRRLRRGISEGSVVRRKLDRVLSLDVWTEVDGRGQWSR